MLDKNFRFSIIVPVYNVEKYVDICLKSILKQTYTNYEVILIDDGSTDKCPLICDEYSESYSNIKVIHKKNGGLSSARNEGLKAAEGDFICFLDSDDYWIDNNCLMNIASTLSESVSDVVVLKYVRYDERTGKFTKGSKDIKRRDFQYKEYDLMLKNLVAYQLYDSCAWDKVIRAELFKKNDLNFREGIIAEDLDWSARVMLAAKSITLVDDPVYVYRVGRKGAITGTLKLKNLVDTKLSIDNCLNVDLRQYSKVFRNAYLSYVAYKYVIWMAEGNQVEDDEKHYLIEEMKKKQWLLGYDLSPKVKAVKYVFKLLGYDKTASLLGMFLKRR